jgi:hypothetical protein
MANLIFLLLKRCDSSVQKGLCVGDCVGVTAQRRSVATMADPFAALDDSLGEADLVRSCGCLNLLRTSLAMPKLSLPPSTTQRSSHIKQVRACIATSGDSHSACVRRHYKRPPPHRSHPGPIVHRHIVLFSHRLSRGDPCQTHACLSIPTPKIIILN